MERNARTRLTTAAILLLVFVSGSLVGMAYDRKGDSNPIEPTVTTATVADSSNGNEGQRRRRLIDRIDLTADQRTAVDAIIEGHRARMDSLNAEFRTTYYPRFYEIVDATRARIVEELSPEQAATYRELLAEWDTKYPRDEREELPFRRRN